MLVKGQIVCGWVYLLDLSRWQPLALELSQLRGCPENTKLKWKSRDAHFSLHFKMGHTMSKSLTPLECIKHWKVFNAHIFKKEHLLMACLLF